MTALLVGGGGATGVPIAQGLEARGHAVTILHRGLHEPAEIAHFEHVHADPHFAASVEAALAGRTFDVVVLAYGRVAELAPLFAGRCARLVAIGGIPIYPGYLDPAAEFPRGMPLLLAEDEARADPAKMGNPGAARFAAKMIAAEDAVWRVHHAGGYSATIVRYPQIYGPRSLGGPEWSLLRRMQDGRGFMLLPDAGLGIITRCSARNAAWCVLEALSSDAAQGLAFNVADERQYTLAGWMEMARAILGAEIELVPLPPQLNWAAAHLLPLGGTATPIGLVDTSRARTVLKFRDQAPIMAELQETLRSKLAQAGPSPVNGDPLDYPLEDRVKAALDQLDRALAPDRFNPPVIHPYPHPREPGLTVDHRGR